MANGVSMVICRYFGPLLLVYNVLGFVMFGTMLQEVNMVPSKPNHERTNELIFESKQLPISRCRPTKLY